MEHSNTGSPELQHLANQVGEFIQYWGFKKIHGRIWLNLYLSPKPLDAREFITRLKVSKALVSMSVSELLKFKVIEEAGKTERGTVGYRANPRVVEVVLNVLKQREKRMLTQISEAYVAMKELGESGQEGLVNKDRVESLGEMITQAESALEGLLALYPVDFSRWESFT